MRAHVRGMASLELQGQCRSELWFLIHSLLKVVPDDATLLVDTTMQKIQCNGQKLFSLQRKMDATLTYALDLMQKSNSSDNENKMLRIDHNNEKNIDADTLPVISDKVFQCNAE
eukprot:CAMPEP_0117767722 /NCGR_PEP_ID=MMETSP0947-20121206/21842_1 /TAXON_ID=44440 /ORGANISM="Chattonella subsalsa, Strain CCMP2191" /LENGTH=113 /DNA_ID=CAMNT_0005591553 /DNA_START=48 /DNA_END=386 /DNA_ORIENTATION=+